MEMFAAVDWGGAHHQVAIANDSGKEMLNTRFAHTKPGVDELIATLHKQESLAGVAIERGEGLLVEGLQAAGLRVFAVSPRVSARARERYQAASRESDRFDAFVLADTLRTDGWRWRQLPIPSPLLAELRAIVRHRRQCLETQIAVEAQLRETLLAYHPGPVALFSSVDRDATLAFVRNYSTPESAARVGQARMEQFCGRIGYSGRVPAEHLVNRLREHLLSGAPGSIEGHRFAALALVDQLELLNRQLKAYNTEISRLIELHPDGPIFTSFPAAGEITGASLLAEIGEDRDYYPTPQILLAEAGVAPVTLASGRVHRVRIRYACNKRLRSTTTTWAYTLKRIDPVSRQRYLAALDRGQTRHAALRSIGASWVRILWRCWQDSTLYDPERRATAQP